MCFGVTEFGVYVINNFIVRLKHLEAYSINKQSRVWSRHSRVISVDVFHQLCHAFPLELYSRGQAKFVTEKMLSPKLR